MLETCFYQNLISSFISKYLNNSSQSPLVCLWCPALAWNCEILFSRQEDDLQELLEERLRDNSFDTVFPPIFTLDHLQFAAIRSDNPDVLDVTISCNCC